MSAPDPPVRSVPRLSATMLVAGAVLAGLVVFLTGLVVAARSENAALRAEIATLQLGRRAAASREGLARDALRRVGRLEEALAQTRRDQSVTATAVTAEAPPHAELERVIAFLRSEIAAAQETIERLKQDNPDPQPASR